MKFNGQNPENLGTNGTGKKSRWWPFNGKRPREGEDPSWDRLALQLHYDRSLNEAQRSVLVVSPDNPETAAQSSSKLACKLAEQLDCPVLLAEIDADEYASVGNLHGATVPGVADFLETPTLRLDEMVLPTNYKNLSFLPYGSKGSGGKSGTADIERFLNAARRCWNFVVLSGGVADRNPLALAAAPVVGCVLIAATENRTRIEDLERAQNVLASCHATKVGLLIANASR